MYEVSRCTGRAPAEPHLAMEVDFTPSTDVLLDKSGDESELAHWNRGKSLFDLWGPILILQPQFFAPLLLPWIPGEVNNHDLPSVASLDLFKVR